MKGVFPVLFTEVEGAVLVEVPDLEILTQGKDFPDAIKMARDAIELMCVDLEKSEEIPKRRDISELQGTFSKEGKTVVSLVDFDSSEYRRKIDFNIKSLNES